MESSINTPFLVWLMGGLSLTLYANRESARKERIEPRTWDENNKVIRPGDVERDITMEALASLAEKENGKNA